MKAMTIRALLSASSIPVLVILSACSKSSEPAATVAAAAPAASSAASPAAGNSCKDFPAPMYPHTSSATCEVTPQRESYPLHHTAYVDSSDSVEQVTQYYQTLAQSSGWTPKPGEGQTAEHAVVVIEKGKAYASIVINPGHGGAGGSSFQINAFPNGNDLN